LVSHNRPEVRSSIRAVVETFELLHAEDIADAVSYIVTRPRRITVNEILVRPTEQDA